MTMIPRTATLRGPRAAIPMGWVVLSLAAASWGLVFVAVQIGQSIVAQIGGGF